MIGFYKQHRSTWDGSSGSTLFDVQSFNFTYMYKLLYKQLVCLKEKQTTNAVWNLAAKELTSYLLNAAVIRLMDTDKHILFKYYFIRK